MKNIVMLLLILFLSLSVCAQDKTKTKTKIKKTVTQIFTTSKREMPLVALIEAINAVGPPKYRNKKILYDSSINKSTSFKVVASQIKENTDDKYYEFHLIERFLSLNGLSIVLNGPFLLVIKSSVTPTFNINLLKPGDLEKDDDITQDEMSIKMITTTYVPPFEIVKVLRPFTQTTKKNVQFHQLSSNNGLMIIAPKSTIRYLTELIKILDIPGDTTRIEILKVEHTLPKEITSRIKELRTKRVSKSSQSQPPILIPDDRTMQIIVKGTDKQIDEIKGLLLKLDQPTKENPLNTEISFYKLKNAKAEEVAATLNNLYQRIKAKKPNSRIRGNLPTTGRNRDDVPTIVAEKNINALLIIGADSDQYNYLLKIIEQLDIRRDQVMIVGSIVEMSESKAWELSVELAAINASRTNVAGKINPFISSNNQSTLNIDGNAPGKVPNINSLLIGVTYGSQEALPFILNASQTDSDVHSIAQPSIMANDNQTASITIEQSVPFQTTSTGANSVTTQSVDFSKAPITLQIKPTINSPSRKDAERYVILDVSVNVSSFIGTGGNGTPPAQSSRQAKTVVTVPDKGVVAIGGLSNYTKGIEETGVPLLSKIPILGNLFKSQRRNRTHSNIYIFISPYIISTFNDAEKYAHDLGLSFESDEVFYKEMKEKIWANAQLKGSGLSDSSFYPKTFIKK
ncbi:MAG: hypothetical protein COA79_16690 [Planctomycetota bacterium]|nr:MAG: hypothetical protein COA79_16690 [Planctomycetota bacterium]